MNGAEALCTFCEARAGKATSAVHQFVLQSTSAQGGWRVAARTKSPWRSVVAARTFEGRPFGLDVT